jgi:signal transduction histidine kinase
MQHPLGKNGRSLLVGLLFVCRFANRDISMSLIGNETVGMHTRKEGVRVPGVPRNGRIPNSPCSSCERKDRFMAVMSHELRNMLAPIVMALEIHSQTTKDTGDSEFLRMATQRARQLSRLIDDLFDACRTATGKVQLRCETIDLRDVVDRSIAAVQAAVIDRKQELLVTRSAEPLWLSADSLRLEQVCVNLLKNANKYTPRGGCIWVQMKREPRTAVFQVRDSGCGFSAELVPRLFNFFSQEVDGDGHSPSGLGIGLALAKSLVEAHRGTIEAHSDGPGRGADFTVRLPLC